MATIKDLTIYLLHRSEPDAYNLIRDLRALRRMMPEKPQRKTKAQKKNPKKEPQTLDMMMDMMSKEQVKELLEKLQNKGS